MRPAEMAHPDGGQTNPPFGSTEPVQAPGDVPVACRSANVPGINRTCGPPSRHTTSLPSIVPASDRYEMATTPHRCLGLTVSSTAAGRSKHCTARPTNATPPPPVTVKDGNSTEGVDSIVRMLVAVPVRTTSGKPLVIDVTNLVARRVRKVGQASELPVRSTMAR